jgi:hypothetical protein
VITNLWGALLVDALFLYVIALLILGDGTQKKE